MFNLNATISNRHGNRYNYCTLVSIVNNVLCLSHVFYPFAANATPTSAITNERRDPEFGPHMEEPDSTL